MRNALAILIALLASVAVGQGGIITFDEVPYQPVNGLTVQGVTFGFAVDGFSSDDAYFNDSSPVMDQVNVSVPVLNGFSEGTLTLSFANPTSLLQFDTVLGTSNDQMPGLWVLLSGPGFALPTMYTMDLVQPAGKQFVEGRFTYSGELITQAVLTFSHADSDRFALDNLVYNGADPASVPEPATMAIMGSGLLLLAGVARRFRTRSK